MNPVIASFRPGFVGGSGSSILNLDQCSGSRSPLLPLRKLDEDLAVTNFYRRHPENPEQGQGDKEAGGEVQRLGSGNMAALFEPQGLHEPPDRQEEENKDQKNFI